MNFTQSLENFPEDNFYANKLMMNLVPSEQLTIQDYRTQSVEKYIYLGHENKIGRDSQPYDMKEDYFGLDSIWGASRF